MRACVYVSCWFVLHLRCTIQHTIQHTHVHTHTHTHTRTHIYVHTYVHTITLTSKRSVLTGGGASEQIIPSAINKQIIIETIIIFIFYLLRVGRL